MRSSEMLRSVDWQFVTDVSGQPIGPIFEGQAVPEECLEYVGMQLCTEWCGRWLVLREHDASQ